MHDNKNNHTYALAISATLSGTTPAAGNVIDLQDYGSATFAFQTGVVTDAGTVAGFGVTIQESDTTNAADFTAVADDQLLGAEADLTVTSDTADNQPIGTIGYRGTKRYIRCVWTGSTGTNAVVNGGVWLGHPLVAPPVAIAANIAAT